MNHQQQTVAEATGSGLGCLNTFYGLKIFDLDSAVVKMQEMFNSHS